MDLKAMLADPQIVKASFMLPATYMSSQRSHSFQDYQHTSDHRVGSQFGGRRVGHHEKGRGLDAPQGLGSRSRKAGKCGRNIRFDTISQDRSSGDKALLFCALLSKNTLLKTTNEHDIHVGETTPARPDNDESSAHPKHPRTTSPTSFSQGVQSYPPQSSTNANTNTPGNVTSNTYPAPSRQYEDISRRYKCDWNGCHKAYGTLNHLNAHISINSHGAKRTPEDFEISLANKKHKCPYCSTEFTRHHNLKSHLLTHSQEKPYKCDTCESRFRRLHDLKRHTKLHKGEKPHVCPKCDRKFARGDALARHARFPGGCSDVGTWNSLREVVDDRDNDTMESVIYGDSEADISNSVSAKSVPRTFPSSLSSVDNYTSERYFEPISVQRPLAVPGHPSYSTTSDLAMETDSGSTSMSDLEPTSALRGSDGRYRRRRPRTHRRQPEADLDNHNSSSSLPHGTAKRLNMLATRVENLVERLGSEEPSDSTASPLGSSQMETRRDVQARLKGAKGQIESLGVMQNKPPKRSTQQSSSNVNDRDSAYAPPAEDILEQLNRSDSSVRSIVGPRPVDVSFWM